MLTTRVSDYPLISQGTTRIPGVNDSEEFELTVVSRELRMERAVDSVIRELVHFYPNSDIHMSAPCKSSKSLMHRFFYHENRYLDPAPAHLENQITRYTFI